MTSVSWTVTRSAASAPVAPGCCRVTIDRMLTTPIMRMVASNSRELTKPMAKPWFWRLTTAYSATAVPMAVRLLTMSSRAPRRTCSVLTPLMMKVGSLRTGLWRRTAGIELRNVSRYRTPATSAVLRIELIEIRFVAADRVVDAMW